VGRAATLIPGVRLKRLPLYYLRPLIEPPNLAKAPGAGCATLARLVAAVYDPKAYTKPSDAHGTFRRQTDATMTETIYTISDERSFTQRFLNEKPPIPIRTSH
jgi:hypothetical protein